MSQLLTDPWITQGGCSVWRRRRAAWRTGRWWRLSLTSASAALCPPILGQAKNSFAGDISLFTHKQHLLSDKWYLHTRVCTATTAQFCRWHFSSVVGLLWQCKPEWRRTRGERRRRMCRARTASGRRRWRGRRCWWTSWAGKGLSYNGNNCFSINGY